MLPRQLERFDLSKDAFYVKLGDDMANRVSPAGHDGS